MHSASASKFVSNWDATERESTASNPVAKVGTSARVEVLRLGAGSARRAEAGVSGCCGQAAVHRLSGRGQRCWGHEAAHLSWKLHRRCAPARRSSAIARVHRPVPKNLHSSLMLNSCTIAASNGRPCNVAPASGGCPTDAQAEDDASWASTASPLRVWAASWWHGGHAGAPPSPGPHGGLPTHHRV